MKTTTRQTRTCKPATGTVRVIQPLGTLPGQPSTAEIEINGTSYLCHCLSGCEVIELVKECGARDVEPTVYLVSSDLSACNCPDALYGNRPNGQCKHLNALKALRNAKKL